MDIPQDMGAMLAARRAKTLEMRRAGLTYQQIADTVPEYHGDKSQPYRDVAASFKQYRREATENMEELRQLEDERDDDLRRKLYAVLTRPHFVVQQGIIVKDEQGVPLRDSMPVLQAIDRLNRIAERYAVRHGLNQAERIEIAFDRRSDEESSAVVEAILAGFEALGLPPEQRLLALEAAQTSLNTVEGEVVYDDGGTEQ